MRRHMRIHTTMLELAIVKSVHSCKDLSSRSGLHGVIFACVYIQHWYTLNSRSTTVLQSICIMTGINLAFTVYDGTPVHLYHDWYKP